MILPAAGEHVITPECTWSRANRLWQASGLAVGFGGCWLGMSQIATTFAQIVLPQKLIDVGESVAYPNIVKFHRITRLRTLW